MKLPKERINHIESVFDQLPDEKLPGWEQVNFLEQLSEKNQKRLKNIWNERLNPSSKLGKLYPKRK